MDGRFIDTAVNAVVFPAEWLRNTELLLTDMIRPPLVESSTE